MNFSLNHLDVYTLKKVLAKTPAKEFTRVVRTCKSLREIFAAGSTWKIMIADATVFYLNSDKFFTFVREHNFQKIPSPPISQDVDFVSFPHVNLTCCSTVYLHSTVIPEISKMKGVETLEIGYKMDPPDLQALLDVLHQPILKYSDCHYDESNVQLRAIENLQVNTNSGVPSSYAQGLKIFTLAKDRNTVTICFPKPRSELVIHVIRSWLKGRDVGRLNLLTYSFDNTENLAMVKSEVMRRIAIEPSFLDLIHTLNDPDDPQGSLGSTMSDQQLITRNPRYGSQRLLLQFTNDAVNFSFIGS